MTTSLKAALVALALTFGTSTILTTFAPTPVEAAGKKKAGKKKMVKKAKSKKKRSGKKAKSSKAGKCGTYMYWSKKAKKCMDARNKK